MVFLAPVPGAGEVARQQEPVGVRGAAVVDDGRRNIGVRVVDRVSQAGEGVVSVVELNLCGGSRADLNGYGTRA
jgi:hypothetical protein